ncbi:hypothetical protein FC47_GL001730 [Limosilactobacillus mucosae DSM 13345]|uniref:Uncharacterized protein n=1 Tax=Limosilactobacillus mucosae DSM 13345 TaxID=1423771 RepID=A0A0R1P116_LIMMU|nr:hypothetical protein FC47_GL001730 [Limosilactobacillus mucosae DSM 13345]
MKRHSLALIKHHCQIFGLVILRSCLADLKSFKWLTVKLSFLTDTNRLRESR